MEDINIWQKILSEPNGLVDSITEIEEFLAEQNINDGRKLEVLIKNIASYFQKNKIIESKITEEDLKDCEELIAQEIKLKHITTHSEFVIQVLIALLSKMNPTTNNYIDYKDILKPDDKIKKISADFIASNKKLSTSLVSELKNNAMLGQKIIKAETIANRQKLANNYKRAYV